MGTSIACWSRPAAPRRLWERRIRPGSPREWPPTRSCWNTMIRPAWRPRFAQLAARKIAAVIASREARSWGTWVSCGADFRVFANHAAVSLEPDGALLIYDEVMTGFRVAYGGAQSPCKKIRPDLDDAGKDRRRWGCRSGRYGGRADVMDHVLPAGRVFQAMARSAAIRISHGGRNRPRLDAAARQVSPYARLEELSARLAAGLSAAATAADVPAHRRPRGKHDDVVLQPRAGDRLADRQPLQHGPTSVAISGA